jgi:DNA-binding MarR family transcriptional regulator
MADSALNYAALAELRHQIRRFLAFSEQEARTAGLEPQQHQLLLAVKGVPEGKSPTIGFLAERLLVRHHTAVGLVDRLVEASLVTRKPSQTDRRRVVVQVTARGERLLRRLSLAHQAELEKAGPVLLLALASLLQPPRTTRSKRAR